MPDYNKTLTVTTRRTLTVSSPPHIYGTDTTYRRMRDVIIALAPASIMGIYRFGIDAFFVIAVAIISALFAEFIFQKVTGKAVTIDDLSAAITGLLLALNLPPDVPLWIAAVGSIFAIIAVKQLFGGLGNNFMNPALAARAFLMAAFPVHMTRFPEAVDAVTSATYLAVLKENPAFIPETADYIVLLFNKIGGCIGETSAVALIIGGVYLIARKVINWRIPVFYIGSFTLFAFIFGRGTFFSGPVLFEVLTGGLLLGAFFMATDYATSPIAPRAKMVFGVGCGFLAVMIRFFGGYPEGVSYSILIMNIFVPTMDKYIRPRIYGRVPLKRRKKA